MAVSDQEPFVVTECPGCGQAVSGVNFCPNCGHAIPQPAARAEEPTEVMSAPLWAEPSASRPMPPPSSAVPPFSPHARSVPHMPPPPPSSPQAGGAPPAARRRRAVVGAALGALGLAVIAVIAIVLLTGSSSSAPHASYRQKLTTVFAPVIVANRSLTTSLQTINGSAATVNAAKQATARAQAAVTAATGGLAVLSAPSSEQTLGQQAQQALTEENGYLQAVAAGLSAPADQAGTQLRALATSAQTAFVPLQTIASDGPASFGGTDNLVSWLQGASAAAKRSQAAAQQKALKQAAQSGSHTTTIVQPPPPTGGQPSGGSAYVTPSGAAVPGSWSNVSASFASTAGTPYAWSGGQACDQNIYAGDGTSCGFANNIFMTVAAASHYANLIPGTITAYDPGSGTSPGVTCTEYTGTDGQDALQCITSSGEGTAFPVWAANVYYG